MPLDCNVPSAVSRLRAEFVEYLQAEEGVDALDRAKVALEPVGQSVSGMARAAKMFWLAGL